MNTHAPTKTQDPFVSNDEELESGTADLSADFGDFPPDAPPTVPALPEEPAVTNALTTLDKLSHAVSAATNINILNALTVQVQAIQKLHRGVKEVSDRAGEIWINADRKLGSELAKLGRARGSQTRYKGRDKSGKPILARLKPEAPNAPSYEQLGFHGRTGARRAFNAMKLNAVPAEKLLQKIERLKAEGKGLSPTAVLKEPATRKPTDRATDPLVKLSRAMAKLDRNDEIRLIKARIKTRNISFAELKA
jgi:hypothetical protein